MTVIEAQKASSGLQGGVTCDTSPEARALFVLRGDAPIGAEIRESS